MDMKTITPGSIMTKCDCRKPAVTVILDPCLIGAKGPCPKCGQWYLSKFKEEEVK